MFEHIFMTIVVITNTVEPGYKRTGYKRILDTRENFLGPSCWALDIKETEYSGNLDIREKKGGPLDSLTSRFDCIFFQENLKLQNIFFSEILGKTKKRKTGENHGTVKVEKSETTSRRTTTI
jgi:hypothetical protein